MPHRGPVQAVCGDPEGRWGVTGGKDGLARLFDAHGRCVWEWAAHEGGIWALAALGAGRVASAGHDHRVKIWSVERRNCVRILEGHRDFVYRLAVLAGGNALASAGADRVIRVWDVQKGRCIRELAGHSRLVSALAPVGMTRLLSASADHSLRFWELETGQCLRTMGGHRQDVLALAVSGDGERAASSSADGELRLWSLPQGESLAAVQAHDQSAEAVCLLRGGTLVSAGWDGRVRWWATRSLRPSRQLRAHHGAIRALHVDPPGRHLFTGGADGVIRVLEARSGRAVCRWAGPAPVTALASVDGSSVLAGFASGASALLTLESLTPRRRKR